MAIVKVDCSKWYNKFLASMFPEYFECKGSPNPNPNPNPQPSDPLTLPAKIKSYGAVNTWMKMSNSVMDSWLSSMQSSGCNCVLIELMGYDEDNWTAKQAEVDSRFQNFVTLARKYKIWVFVNIGNRGSETLVNQPDQWFTDRLAMIKKLGPDFLIVQAWSEWSDAKAAQQCEEALNTLPNFKHSYNKDSRPNPASVDKRYAIVDWHINSMTELGPDDPRLLANTDTTSVLNQMMVGGVTGKKFKEPELKSVATSVLSSSRKGFAAYGYAHDAPDYQAIKIIGAIGGANPQPNPTPDEQGEINNGLKFKDVRWVSGPCPIGKPITVQATNLRLHNDSPSVGFDWSKHLWTPNDGHCDGALGVVWLKDGIWYGAYIEWCPMNLTGYNFPNPLENMYHNNAHKPFAVKGDKCGFFIMARDAHERSNVVFGTWPINDDNVMPLDLENRDMIIRGLLKSMSGNPRSGIPSALAISKEDGESHIAAGLDAFVQEFEKMRDSGSKDMFQ